MDSFFPLYYSIKKNKTQSPVKNRGLKDPPIFKALRELYRDRRLTDAIALLEESGIKSPEFQLFLLDSVGVGDE